MLGQDFQTFQQFTECKKELSESDTTEDKYTLLLRKLNNLGASISQDLKDTERIAKKIHNEAVHCDREFNVTQLIGKTSVRPLADLMKTATEVFADVKDNFGSEFIEKEANFEEYYQEQENLEKTLARNRRFLTLLKSASEGLHEIVDAVNKEKTCSSHSSSSSDNDKTLEITAEDTNTSTVNFSVFENSATRAPTSSPLQNC